jgi:hypothetical protein
VEQEITVTVPIFFVSFTADLLNWLNRCLVHRLKI